MANNSSHVFALTERNAVVGTDYLTEENLKNQAYCFIIACELIGQFAEFCRNVKAQDFHAACISYLYNQVMED